MLDILKELWGMSPEGCQQFWKSGAAKILNVIDRDGIHHIDPIRQEVVIKIPITTLLNLRRLIKVEIEGD